MDNMGNPQLKKRPLKSLSIRPPMRDSRRDMDFLPVPLTTFDGGQTQSSTSLLRSLKNQFPHVLLIECMLERMCSIYESEPDKQKELYAAIRKYFINFRLLPPYSGSPEMDGVRLRVVSDLNNLFRLAKLQITSNQQISSPTNSLAVANPSPLSGSVWSTGDGSEHLFASRYELDFKEIGYIAAGGFGVVYKAQNILDNTEYAIKKIIIGPRSANKILREVQLLSQLHHPNIVAYKSAWLEYSTPQTTQRILRHMDDFYATQDGASTVNFSSTSYSRVWSAAAISPRNSDNFSNKSDSIVFESENSQETALKKSFQSPDCDNSNPSSSVVLSSLRRPYNRLLSSPPMLLYIQMQLCQQTLRNWLNNRNAVKKDLEDIDLELSIFRQIVKGIDYIHSRNIIHRDVKPENIFIDASASQVLIGDFGLAVHSLRNEAGGSNALSATFPDGNQLTSKGVGTHAYAAPEQLSNRESDAKSDIYSLGIVLLELLTIFQTVMERYKIIEKLRTHGEIPKEIMLKWPWIGNLISKMISHDQSSRPTIQEVKANLDLDKTSSRKTTALVDSSPLSNEQLLSIIEDLRRQVVEKDLIIEQLKRNSQQSI